MQEIRTHEDWIWALESYRHRINGYLLDVVKREEAKKGKQRNAKTTGELPRLAHA